MRMKFGQKAKFFLAGILMTAGCAGRQVEYIAHRGASWEAPENTLSAIRRAWEAGADAVEVDVHLTADNRLAVIHDKDTRRTAGVDWQVSQKTLHELQSLDVGRWKAERFAGERIPTLEEVLDLVPPGKRLFIEIKCKSEILPFLEKAVSESGKRAQVVLICFDPDVLVQCKQQMPDIPAYWLVGTEKDNDTGKPVPHSAQLLSAVREKNLDGLDVHYEGLSEDFVKAARKAGQDLYVWTVDTSETANRLIQWGVKGITTNRPDHLKKAGAAQP